MNKAIAALTLAVLLAAASPASAHLRSGTVAVDYKAAVLSPSTPAYTARIYQSDRALNLALKPGHTVAVVGYLGEPMFRLDAAGLWVNAASPTSVVAGLVPKRQRVAGTNESWRLHRGKHSVTWRDSRAQGLPPGMDFGPWRVPLVVDGRRAALGGTLRRYPKPALLPWLAALAAFAAAAAGLALARRDDITRSAAISLALTAALSSVLTAVVFSLDAYASPGTWIASFDEIFFAVVGVWAITRGPARWRIPAAIGLGLLSVAVGVSKGAIFLHPIVLAIVPGTLARILVIVAIGGGLAAAALAGATYITQPSPSARPGGIVPTA
jgi:hypothetical protein